MRGRHQVTGSASSPRRLRPFRQRRPVFGDGQTKRWHAIEEPPQSDLSFESGQRRAQAVVDALSEGQVAVPLAPQVEDVGLLELRLVAVRRRQDTIHEGPRGMMTPAISNSSRA